MINTKFATILSILTFALILGNVGCSKAQSPTAVKDYAFIVQGVSGNDVMLDRTWYQECIPGVAPGIWTKSMRTMSGRELATTITEYQNGSETPDCRNAVSSVTVFVQTLHNDGVRVPITWADAAGNPVPAPAGMENVTEGNGATGTIMYASVTVITQGKADQLNTYQFCSKTDWAAGTTNDMMACFPSGAKGTVIVDDRTGIGYVYDGISVDPTQYPTMIPVTPPHAGPLTQIKF